VGFVEWRAIGDYLCRVSGASQWWIGDWLVAGAERFIPAEPEDKSKEGPEQKHQRKAAHKRYAHAVDATGYDLQTLKQKAWVSRNIISSRRRDDISWSHHVEVLALANELEQDKFLALASKDKWSRSKLRQAIRAYIADKSVNTKSNGAAVIDFTPGRWANQFTKWISVRVKDRPISEWSKAERIGLRRELRPIVDVYEELEPATPRKESLMAISPNR